ncbi:WAT1-related protein At5g40240-like [Rutidosis leptorrhynchoides]|uniref:WAT1-related protein At5g40240-like n=1 Tax=Rutidosis leptorrhynchoides TaxID=125765 RepID=UPI003A992DF2
MALFMTNPSKLKAVSYRDEVLPYIVMLMVTCAEMGSYTISKSAMNGGMKSLVYVVYQNSLGTMILFFIYIVHPFSDIGRLELGYHILFRFFILGFLGICLYQVLVFEGVRYSSPTMASAISNLIPATTFIIAIIFKMEKVDIRRSSGVAKLLGTFVTISGATLFTVYKGPVILQMIPHSDSTNGLFSSHPPNWLFGGLILLVSVIVGSVWRVLQATTMREYPDQITVVFFFCLFGTLQCIAVSPFLVPNLRYWVVKPGIEMIAIAFGAVFGIVFRMNAISWCLEKKGPVFVSMFTPLSIVIAVVMGVTCLGDALHLGSIVAATVIFAGFYTVMWGQAKEMSNLTTVMEDEPGLSDQTAPLLSSTNESKC